MDTADNLQPTQVCKVIQLQTHFKVVYNFKKLRSITCYMESCSIPATEHR